jgi:hypothetical protein
MARVGTAVKRDRVLPIVARVGCVQYFARRVVEIDIENIQANGEIKYGLDASPWCQRIVNRTRPRTEGDGVRRTDEFGCGVVRPLRALAVSPFKLIVARSPNGFAIPASLTVPVDDAAVISALITASLNDAIQAGIVLEPMPASFQNSALLNLLELCVQSGQSSIDLNRNPESAVMPGFVLNDLFTGGV